MWAEPGAAHPKESATSTAAADPGKADQQEFEDVG